MKQMIFGIIITIIAAFATILTLILPFMYNTKFESNVQKIIIVGMIALVVNAGIYHVLAKNETIEVMKVMYNIFRFVLYVLIVAIASMIILNYGIFKSPSMNIIDLAYNLTIFANILTLISYVAQIQIGLREINKT